MGGACLLFFISGLVQLCVAALAVVVSVRDVTLSLTVWRLLSTSLVLHVHTDTARSLGTIGPKGTRHARLPVDPIRTHSGQSCSQYSRPKSLLPILLSLVNDIFPSWAPPALFHPSVKVVSSRSLRQLPNSQPQSAAARPSDHGSRRAHNHWTGGWCRLYWPGHHRLHRNMYLGRPSSQ